MTPLNFLMNKEALKLVGNTALKEMRSGLTNSWDDYLREFGSYRNIRPLDNLSNAASNRAYKMSDRMDAMNPVVAGSGSMQGPFVNPEYRRAYEEYRRMRNSAEIIDGRLYLNTVNTPKAFNARDFGLKTMNDANNFIPRYSSEAILGRNELAAPISSRVTDRY